MQAKTEERYHGCWAFSSVFAGGARRSAVNNYWRTLFEVTDRDIVRPIADFAQLFRVRRFPVSFCYEAF
jgi:hypothetical protein